VGWERPLRRAIAGFIALAAVGVWAGAGRSEGVVVERVRPEGRAAAAGLVAGDRITAYAQGSALLPIHDILDWRRVQFDLLLRGAVQLRVVRGAADRTVEVTPGTLGARVRPLFRDRDERAYQEGKSLVDRKELPAGLALWETLAERRPRSPSAFWLELRMASLWSEQEGGAAKALAAADRARDAARTLGSPEAEAAALVAVAKAHGLLGEEAAARRAFEEARGVLSGADGRGLALASVLWEASDWESTQGEGERAESLVRESLALYDRLAPSCLEAATVETALGISLWFRGKLPEAEEQMRRALAVWHELAPGTLEEASLLSNLGGVLADRGDLEGAEAFQGRALELKERLAPDSLTLAVTLNNLGLVELDRGDLAAAEAHLRRAIVLRERLDPGSLDGATVCANLALAVWARGSLDEAERLLQRALAVQRAVEPEGLHLAKSLNNLAMVMEDRGDLNAAESYYREALALHETLDPGSLDVAAGLENLGTLSRQRGDLPGAEALMRRALEIQQRLAPESVTTALGLVNLAVCLEKGNDLAGAEGRALEALSLYRKIAPASLGESFALQTLAEVALKRRDLPEAEALAREALALRERLASDSFQLADSAHLLGRVFAERGDLNGALPYLEQAVGALEAQRGHLGGGSRAAEDFGQLYANDYRDLLEVQVRAGQTAKAYRTLERARAQTLLQMLAERDLDFSRDAPAALLAEQRRVDLDYERVQKEIAGLNAQGQAERLQALQRRQLSLREVQARVREEIRGASPGLASLEYPQPFDAARAGAALDPGTLALAYSVGEKRSFLFALGPEPGALAAFEIPIGRPELAAKIRRFRGGLDGSAPQGVEAQALTDLLLRPARAQLRRARRLLVLPDGPLHVLPFGALPEVAVGGRSRRFLLEALPVHSTLSLTLYDELRKHRRADRETRLVAFGAPDYTGGAEGADRRTPLPWTRGEADAVCAAGLGPCQEWLGAEATESRAKAVGPGVAVLHFACHGLLDERFPLDSALALAAPASSSDGENGLLQAWEIFESVRLDADLVTLSACETGLGKEKGGEGLIGLTRAFQYAGARTVVSSLWSVSDAGTAELMRRFYGFLKAGKPKDEALRLAQVDLLRGRAGQEFSDPFHWAAFQLYGDWR